MRLQNDVSVTTRLSLALFLLTLVSFVDSQAIAATLKVPSKYDTIQEAIDAASAGDTIKISKGRYTENIVVDKSLTIRGKKYKTRIQAADDASPVVTVAADNVVLKQFDTRGGSFGVTASNVSNLRLQSLRVQNAQADGVFLRNVTNASLNKCRVYDNGGIGIFLEGNDPGAGSAIQKCRVYDNSGNGISLEQPGTLVESNRIYNNGQTGIYGGDQVRRLRIRKNRVWGHAVYGIMFGYESGGHVAESNVCSENGIGLFLAGSAGVAKRNICEKNEIGIEIGISAWLVENNKARKNTSDGFVVENDAAGSNDILRKNESTDNGGHGYRLESGTSDSLFTDNLARGNAGHGFLVRPFGGDDPFVLEGNRAISNGGDGFNVEDTTAYDSGEARTVLTDNFADSNTGFGFGSDPANVNVVFDGNECGGNNAAGPSDPVGLCD